VACSLAACGGGGGGGSDDGDPGPVAYTPGVYQPSSGLAAICAAPRSGTDPTTGRAYPDRQGSAANENNFLRSWTQELYLWYREVPDRDPNPDATPAYFNLLKTSATTSSGQPKDKFHFTYDTATWVALSQSGVEAGYGAQWAILAAGVPRRIVVAYVQANTAAATAGLTRGVEILKVDGADAVNGNTQAIVDTLNAGLFPRSAGESHTFEIRELSGLVRTVTMSSANVSYDPVPNVAVLQTPSGPVGYLLFNDHVATAESRLIQAIEALRGQQVVDLVLDLRYNGGGYLDIASQLAYMIGGQATLGRTFERMTFSDKYPSTNPVTGQALSPIPFHRTTLGFSVPAGSPLPTLDLPRVYVLAGGGTCSASESVINSLRGVNIAVHLVGSTTCGKPYGFYPRDNCGTTYFSIQFKGVNEQGFGDYTDGFSPQSTAGVAGERLPGCSVADDFTRALGDPAETRLAAALAYRASNNQSCPVASGLAPGALGKPGAPLSASDGVLPRSPLRENRLMREGQP
jgi:C-terminal processing protease CtpA/Prc